MCEPLTFNTEEYVAFPALLVAIQVYSPACSALTDSILIVLMRLFTFPVDIPCIELTDFPLNNHDIVIGKSPFVTAQLVVAMSPELTISSPKSKCKICGATS